MATSPEAVPEGINATATTSKGKESSEIILTPSPLASGSVLVEERRHFAEKIKVQRPRLTVNLDDLLYPVIRDDGTPVVTLTKDISLDKQMIWNSPWYVTYENAQKISSNLHVRIQEWRPHFDPSTQKQTNVIV